MRLSRYIQRTRALGDAAPPAHEIDAIEDAVECGEALPQLLKARPTSYPGVSPRQLLAVWRAAHALKAHKQHLETVAARRRADGLPPIPTALLAQTVTPHEVAVLERAEALAPPGQAAEHRRRDAIKEALQVWNGCLAIARRDGGLEIEVVAREPTLRAEFGDLGGSELLGEVAAHRWLAMRRGESAGALLLALQVPLEPLIGQIEAHRTGLSALSGGRDAGTLLQALVLDDLETAAFELKDEEAEQKAVQTASEAYLGLLCSPRPKANQVAGVWVGAPGTPLGVAIVQRDGRLVRHAEVDAGGDPVAAVEGVLGGEVVEVIALPIKAEDPDTLATLGNGFGPAFQVVRMKSVAMRQGVELAGEGLPDAAARALVTARRCVRPLKYWGQIDPVGLGLAEYQQDLDAERLRRALEDVRALAAAGVKPEDLARPTNGPASSARPAPRVPAAPLNPLVKGVDDLRPGMRVNGLITNITQFGAFVNIGLSHEGLVHVSEMAEHFVKDPNEVVRVGQQVSARVLGVDRARGRISLSLKPDRVAGAPASSVGAGGGAGAGGDGGPGASGERKRVPLDFIPGERRGGRPQGGGYGTGRGPGNQAQSGASRAQALAELEALFKKPKG